MTPDEMEFLAQSVRSHDRQLGELTDQISELREFLNQVGSHIEAVTAQVAELSAMVKVVRHDQGIFERDHKILLDNMILLAQQTVQHGRRIGNIEENQ
jgi:chromosome segregation ATPase